MQLDDAANFFSGGTPKKDNPHYWNGDVPWFSATNMGERFLRESRLRLTEDGLANGSRLASKGSTLLLVRGSGLFNYIPICYADSDVAFNQDVKAISPKQGVDPLFLHYAIEVQRKELNNNIGVTGIGAGKFDTDFLKSLPFPDVPSEDQPRIGELASSFDRKIENNRRMNETLEAMAQAIFKDWFVDFGPVRRKASGMTDPVAILGGLITDPEKATQTAALFPDSFGDDGLPDGWEAGTLEKWADVNIESWTNKNHPQKVEYVDLTNTKWGTIEETDILDWTDAPSRARRIVRPHDSIVATTRPGNGSFAFINEEGLTASTGFAVLRPKKSEYSQIIYCAATCSENIARLAQLADGHGGAYPAVKPIEVLTSPMPSCPTLIVAQFEKLSFPMREKIDQARIENKTLAETRDYLLPRLMSGQIRACAIGKVAA